MAAPAGNDGFPLAVSAQTLNPVLREGVDAECGAEIGGEGDALRVERDAGCVGNPVDCVEKADDRGGIDERRVPDALAESCADSRQAHVVEIENSFGEIDQ